MALNTSIALPDGRRGQLLAVGLTVLALALLWLGVVAPLMAWNDDLAERRAIREALAARMEGLAKILPELKRQAAAPSSPPAARAVLEGASDAIAAAALQERIQEMGRKAGVTLSSAESLPSEAVGPYRRIVLRVSLNGTWADVVRFLQEIAQASPRMLVDDLTVQRGALLAGADAKLSVSFSVFGLRVAAGPQPASG